MTIATHATCTANERPIPLLRGLGATQGGIYVEGSQVLLATSCMQDEEQRYFFHATRIEHSWCGPSLFDMNSESRCESMCDYLSDSDDEYLSMVVVEPTRRSKNLGAVACAGTGTMLEKPYCTPETVLALAVWRVCFRSLSPLFKPQP